MGVKISSSIIFLGTGGDSYVVGRQLRASGGIILQIDGDQFHIDPGPGALVMAKEAGINLRANTAIFVTHNHINHCNDINAVIDAMSYGGFDKTGVLVANNTVINGSAHYETFLHKFYRDCLERYIILEPGKKVGINDVEIMAIKAKHSEPNAIGFKFITSEYTLSYTGDTAYSVEIIPDYYNSDILILNVPCLNKEECRNNLCKEDAINIITKVKPRLAIITHFGINFLKSDILNQVREIQKITGIQVIVAKDGMVVNPISYSAESRQKTMNKYTKKEGLDYPKLSHNNEEVKEIDDVIEDKQTMLESNKPEDIKN